MATTETIRAQQLEIRTLLWRIARTLMSETEVRDLREQLYGPTKARKRTANALRLVRGGKRGAS